jgi:transcription elongation GreA/GreB family factor
LRDVLAKKIIAAIITELDKKLAVQIKAAKDAHFAATHSESVAKGKYETFGLESSYLAQGQQKRVAEITASIHYFKNIRLANEHKVRHFIEPLCFVALDDADQSLYFFVAEQAGGLRIFVQGKEIAVITPKTPIGISLIDKMVGDEVEILLKGNKKSFEVVDIR